MSNERTTKMESKGINEIKKDVMRMAMGYASMMIVVAVLLVLAV